LDVVAGLDGTERGYQRLCLGEIFCIVKQEGCFGKEVVS
ncbi:hypothetical protein Tco_0856958, partial [Tanacetum coccineum]